MTEKIFLTKSPIVPERKDYFLVPEMQLYNDGLNNWTWITSCNLHADFLLESGPNQCWTTSKQLISSQIHDNFVAERSLGLPHRCNGKSLLCRASASVWGRGWTRIPSSQEGRGTWQDGNLAGVPGSNLLIKPSNCLGAAVNWMNHFRSDGSSEPIFTTAPSYLYKSTNIMFIFCHISLQKHQSMRKIPTKMKFYSWKIFWGRF